MSCSTTGWPADEARSALQRLRTSLRLSYAELGRMFGVSDESARRWERGLTAVPVGHKPQIDEAHGALRRLLGLFRASRLPALVRRSADVFGGKTALDWILDGRIGEVASHYERALQYQPQ